jgi:uncharacterized membrane protein
VAALVLQVDCQAVNELIDRILHMGKTRLEAFSDGVLAIIITIMVLELKVPEGDTLAVLKPLFPTLLSYVLSFTYIGIYWNNHHHLLHTCNKVTGAVLWSNLHLLFWLSLLPFTTGWMGENHFASLPTAMYGFVLFMAACAYTILQKAIMHAQGSDSLLGRALGKDWKGKSSIILYIFGIVCAYWQPLLAQAIYAGVAIMWVVPDKRIETQLHANEA